MKLLQSSETKGLFKGTLIPDCGGRGALNVPLFCDSLAAFTLAEVLIATAIAAISISGVVYGYTLAAQRAEWSAYNLAAQSLASQRMEQTRAAKWDTLASPPIDELVQSNFPPVTTNILDIPISGTNIVYATNVTTITMLSTSPALKMIEVNCSWRFIKNRVYTNRLVTYRTSDQ